MWCNFQQTPSDDDTINQNFCTTGLFKISGEDVVLKYPNVRASVQNKKMIVAIDQKLILLEDENVAKCSFVGFDSPIDAIAVSPSGNLIICALTNGEIHGIHILGICLFNCYVNIDDIRKNKTFVGFQHVNETFYLCCTNGSVYCLNNIDDSFDNLNISINANETEMFEDLNMDKVTVTRLATVKNLNDVSAFILIPTFLSDLEDLPFLSIYGTKSFLRFHGKNGIDSKITIPDHFEGVRSIYNLENFVLILTNSGHLLEICTVTKVINFRPSYVQDQMLIDELIAIENNEETIEFQILTKADKLNGNVRFMKFIEYPSFRVINELEMPTSTWLVNQPKCSVNLYYLMGERFNDHGIPQEIEMKLLSETQPADRVKKLIAKGYLEEAEEFGKQFNLSLQPIYEAKAKRIIISMSTSNYYSYESAAKQFEDLVEILQQIESKNFFRNNYSISMPTRQLLGMYLHEMQKRLKDDTDAIHILEIKEQQLRLETLDLIDPFESNPDWQKFIYHPNIEKECIAMFKSDMLTACLIWKRHLSSIIPKLEYEDLCKLLTKIPNNTEPFNIVQWIRHFIPAVLSLYPNIMPILTDWSIQKIRSLQFSEYWPEIGLEFATKVTDIFDEINFIHCDIRRQYEKNINKLRDLVNALQDLSVLKKSYHLTFTLDSYLQESIDQRALCVLQRVHLSNLKSLVNDFLYPIFREKGQSPVNAICKYINFLVTSRFSLSSWLERAVTSIELLHNEDDRLECSLLVLKSAPAPWPEVLNPLIKLRYTTHPLATKINTEYEMQFIKIIKVKYGWSTDATHNIMKLVYRIVKEDLPEMTDDIKELTKANPNVAADAHYYCCYELARKGKIENAMKFLDNLESSQKTECCEKAINIISRVLEDTRNHLSEAETKNLREFSKLISSQLPSKSDQELFKSIQNLQTLQKRFELDCPSLQTLRLLETRLYLLNKGIENIIKKSQTTSKTTTISEYIWKEVTILANSLNLQNILGIVRVCQRMNCLPLTCMLAYYSIELIECSNENSELLMELAITLIAQQVDLCKNNPAKASVIVLDNLSYPLAYNLLVNSLEYEKKYRMEVIEFIKWIRVVKLSYDLNIISKNYQDMYEEMTEQIVKFLEVDSTDSTVAVNCSSAHQLKRQSVSIFDEVICAQQNERKKASINLSFPIVKFMSQTLLLIILELKPVNEIFLKLSEKISDSAKEDIDGAREGFFISLELLIKTKLHSTWYNVAQYILQYQKNVKTSIISADFVSLHMRRVFRDMLRQKEPNFIDLFAMLINEKNPNALLDVLMEDCKTHHQKINVLTLSEMYSTHKEDAGRLESIKRSRIKYFCYMELCKQDPSIKGMFDINTLNTDDLMLKFQNMQLDVDVLKKLSKDFDRDYQQTLVLQVITVLNTQEILFEVKTDTFFNEELVMLSSVKKIESLCQPYINEIKDTELLASKLLHFIGEINYYFYELYLCVIEILTYIDAMPESMHLWKNILLFLKHKTISKRRHRPSQTETDWWLQSQSEIGVLPKIAKYRLPFMPIVQQPLKDILDNEVCIDNCESWFPLIQMHTTLQDTSDLAEIKKMQDYFCMSAVKNCIADYKAKNDSDTWNLQPTNNAFLKSILRLVQHVTNATKGLMILYFVSNYAPDGADQVEASHECYKFALRHEQELVNVEKGQEILVKIKRKYPILKTQHILHVYGLVEDKLIQLVENPSDLIIQLYSHEIILSPNKPDINKMAREIAKLYGLDFDAIQFNLLEKWLLVSPESMETTAFEETFFEDANISRSMNSDLNSLENVTRAYYILNSWEKDKAMTYLVGSIFPHDHDVNASKQLLLYECFSQLNDGSTHFTHILNQQIYITIKCVHELKLLGYNFNVKKFADYNKIDILKKIWQNHPDNSSTLETMANICLGFEIYLPQIWSGILKRMANFKMLPQLNALVDLLSCKPELLHIDGLAIAWEFVLKVPFKKANRTKSFEQEHTLIKTLFRLQSCPLITKFNLYEMAEDCVKLDRPYMGAIMIALCNKEDQIAKIKELFASRKNEKLRKEIMDLKEYGILSSILNSALNKLQF